MLQVRIHGRGGQGVVTAAELLSVAAFAEGFHAQAFPSFGSERMGAPVVAFARFGATPIRSREPVTKPDVLIVQDPTLLHQVDLFRGFGPEGYLLINTGKSWEDLGIEELLGRHHPDRIRTVPATEIAREHIGRPLPNAVLLGAMLALTGALQLESLERALREKFPPKAAEANIRAARAAFDRVLAQQEKEYVETDRRL